MNQPKVQLYNKELSSKIIQEKIEDANNVLAKEEVISTDLILRVRNQESDKKSFVDLLVQIKNIIDNSADGTGFTFQIGINSKDVAGQKMLEAAEGRSEARRKLMEPPAQVKK